MKKEEAYTTSFVSAKSIDLESKQAMDIRYANNSVSEVFIGTQDMIALKDKVNVDIIYKEEEVYSTYYRANKIYKTTTRSIRINEFEENDTTIFVLPCLGLPKHQIKFHANFVNSYLTHYNYADKLGDTLFLVYRYMPFNFYEDDIIKTLSRSTTFLTKDRDEDARFDIIRMEIPEMYKEDVIKMTKGMYRELSTPLKHNILLFDNRKRDDIIRQVLYDADELRDKLSEQFGVAIPKEVNLRTPPVLSKEQWFYTKSTNKQKI